QWPVIPAFEIIATVASDSPGDDGDYSNESQPDELRPYVDAITEAGGYAFLDLQPGRARLIDQAKMYEDLLKQPNVGLALDPEWKIGPDEVPMTNVATWKPKRSMRSPNGLLSSCRIMTCRKRD